MNEIINPGMQEVVIDKDRRQTKTLFRFLMFVRNYIALINNEGFSGTIVTAPITALGAQGSMTFQNGILTAQTPAT
jgi:spore germination protein YaaH